MSATIRIGTSGFSYKEWLGGFYPEKLPGAKMLAHYAQRLPQSWIRVFVIIIGSAMTVYFFINAYLMPHAQR